MAFRRKSREPKPIPDYLVTVEYRDGLSAELSDIDKQIVECRQTVHDIVQLEENGEITRNQAELELDANEMYRQTLSERKEYLLGRLDRLSSQLASRAIEAGQQGSD